MLVHVFARGSAATRAGGAAVLELLHGAGATRSVLLDAPYNDSFKLELINAHLASLPDGTWATTPDVDELYHYPCRPGTLQRLNDERRANLLCGTMEDMLA